jgi:hypothetical protein
LAGTDLVTRKAGNAVSSIDPSNSAPRSRRRLAAWLAFGAVGLATGAVWASGFVSSTAATHSDVASDAIAKTNPAVASSPLSGTVTAGAPLPIDWEGRWGSIATDSTMAIVDLSDSKFAGNFYNIALLLANTSVLTGWSSLQLKVEQIDVATAADCTPAAFAGTDHPKILSLDDEDAGVYWNHLAGGSAYCLGVNVAAGDDTTGTFLRGSDDTATPYGYPSFITTVDRES